MTGRFRLSQIAFVFACLLAFASCTSTLVVPMAHSSIKINKKYLSGDKYQIELRKTKDMRPEGTQLLNANSFTAVPDEEVVTWVEKSFQNYFVSYNVATGSNANLNATKIYCDVNILKAYFNNKNGSLSSTVVLEIVLTDQNTKEYLNERYRGTEVNVAWLSASGTASTVLKSALEQVLEELDAAMVLLE